MLFHTVASPITLSVINRDIMSFRPIKSSGLESLHPIVFKKVFRMNQENPIFITCLFTFNTQTITSDFNRTY